MTLRELADRVAYFRNRAKMSAKELSIRIEMNDAYIRTFESKPFNISSKTLFRILEVLNVSVEEFFFFGIDYNDKTKQLLTKFNRLTKENQQTILDLVDKLQ